MVSFPAKPPIAEEGGEYWLQREEVAGREVAAELPWLVVSHAKVNERRIFIGVSEPPADGDPIARPLCVERDATGGLLIDCQQIWTFLAERIANVRKEGNLDLDGLNRARSAIAMHLEAAIAPSTSWLCQGRIVWIRLVPLHEAKSNRSNARLSVPTHHSDITAWRQAVASLLGFDPKNPSDWRLPAIVLTNDRYLPAEKNGPRPAGVHAVLTAVPLVIHERLLRRGAPKIPHPRASSISYAPVTQFLMTVSYDSLAADGQPRLIVDREGFENWRVEQDTLRRILDEVHGLLNL